MNQYWKWSSPSKCAAAIASTGTGGTVQTLMCVGTITYMECVASVEEHIEQTATLHAKLLSKLDLEKEQLAAAEHASMAMERPRSISNSSKTLKWKADDNFYIPLFHHGCMWGGSPSNTISPSALYMERAPPLLWPPDHLVNKSKIQSSLQDCGRYIKVDTTFNINRLSPVMWTPKPLIHQICPYRITRGIMALWWWRLKDRACRGHIQLPPKCRGCQFGL